MSVSGLQAVRRATAHRGAAALAGLVCALLIVPAQAHSRHHVRHAGHHHRTIHRAAAGWHPVQESIVLDAATGRVLSESNADALTYPASLTKMMTLYLTFKALNSGKLRLDQRLPVSAEAASRPPTKLGLRSGDSVRVRNLILGIVTKSANDAAVVLAEGLAGSQSAFALRMNEEARRLGMTHTVYRNASGLPNPAQHTTARDVARLALALYHDFPREYRYFATRSFDFRGRTVVGHDHLLDWYPGADGIKTGFIDASGFNLASSAVRDGHRLIGVVMGGHTYRSRDLEMAALLDQGFARVGVPTAVAQRGAPVRPRAAVQVVTGSSSSERAGGDIARVARRALRNLAPVGKAEAASLHQAATADAARHWSIQLGAFRAESAAKRIARAASRLRIARGKPLVILQPAKWAKTRLYRPRLRGFTPKQAEAACVALHRRKLPCAVVHEAVVKYAAGR